MGRHSKDSVEFCVICTNYTRRSDDQWAYKQYESCEVWGIQCYKNQWQRKETKESTWDRLAQDI